MGVSHRGAPVTDRYVDSASYARAQPFIRRMTKNRDYLTTQEFLTLKGQAVHGHIDEAEAGLKKILNRKMGEEVKNHGG